MRAIGGLLLIALTAGAANTARAADEDSARTALKQAVFSQPKAAKPDKRWRVEPRLAQGDGPTPVGGGDQSPLAADRLLSSTAWALSGGATAWRSQSVTNIGDGGASNTVRLTVGTVARGPGGLVLAGPEGRFQGETQRVDLDFEHNWPSALSLQGGRYDVDVAPHAGLAMSDTGGSALAGASVRLQLPQSRGGGIAGRFGFAPEPARDASRGRWFLFAESSGELVGVHLSRDPRSLMPHAALTVDDGVQPTVVSDSQAGIGWRRGALQASFGYVHREIRNDAGYDTSRQIGDIKGDMVALSFSLKSR